MPVWRIALALLFLAVPPALADSGARVGLLPLTRLGPADPAYDALPAQLHDALTRVPEVTPLELSAGSCGAEDLACVAQRARAKNASHFLRGTVEQFTDGYVLRLELVNASSLERNEVRRVVQGAAADLHATAEAAACELLTRDRCVGVLRVDGVAGARVLLSAREIGRVPFEGPLSIGRHRVRVAHDGQSSEEKLVGIAYRTSTALRVEQGEGKLTLVAAERPARKAEPAPSAAKPAAAPAPSTRPESAAGLRPAFWTAAAFASGVTLVGVTFGVMSELNAMEANARFDKGTLRTEDRALYQRSREQAGIANVCFGLGALGLATAGVLYLVSPAAVSEPARAPAPPPRLSAVVTPAGLAVAGAF